MAKKSKKKPPVIQSRGISHVFKDVLNRITRGGLQTNKRTDKHVKKAK